MQITDLGGRFWQVRVGDSVAGYVDEIEVAGETRYRARRLQAPSGRWSVIGEWWELDAALEACADVAPATARVRKITVPPQTRWF